LTDNLGAISEAKYEIMKYQNLVYSKIKKNLRQCTILRLILLLWAISSFISSPSIAASADRLQISFSDNRLSVHIENSSLFDVLEKMQDETGLIFAVAEDAGYQNVTVQFNSLPIENALKIILYDFNYSFVYDTDGKIQNVTILNGLLKVSPRETRPTSDNGSDATYRSESLEPESHQTISFNDQRETTETRDISVSSNSIMIVQPPDSQKMNIINSSQPMRINPPKANDTMEIDFASQTAD
jgi:hypothetical protein